MNITDQEIEMLEAVQTEDEWNEACDKIKQVRNNQYPSDWWGKVRMSGLMDRVFARFGATTELSVSVINIQGIK